LVMEKGGFRKNSLTHMTATMTTMNHNDNDDGATTKW
jgi:hypothetical protein